MNTVKNQLVSYGDLIAKLTQLEQEGHAFSESRIQEVFTELKSLLDESIVELQLKIAGPSDASKLAVVTESTDGPVTSTEDFIREVETLRMRMVGVLVMGSRERFPIQDGNLPQLSGALITTASGITYGTAAGYCTMLLPSFERAEQETHFGRDMLEVHDYAIKTQGLLIDCSAVKRMPLMVQAVLLGYRHTLVSRGKDFSVVWLHISAVEKQMQENIAQVFRGEFIGEYLFTKRE